MCVKHHNVCIAKVGAMAACQIEMTLTGTCPFDVIRDDDADANKHTRC